MKRVFFRIALGAAGVLGVLAIAMAALFGWSQSTSGRAWLADRIAHLVSVPGATIVTIGQIDGNLYRRLHVRDIAVKDPSRAWLTVKSAEVFWRPLHLLRGVVHLDTLRVNDIRVDRRPATRDDGGPPLSGLHTLHRSPSVTVRALDIEDLTLGARVLGTAAVLRIEGAIDSDSDAVVSGTLSIRRRDGVKGTARIAASYRPEDDRVSVDLDIAEAAGGLMVRALGIPDLPAVSVDIKGEGPRTAWQGRSTVSFDGVASATTEIAVQSESDLKFQISGAADIAARQSEPSHSLWTGTHRYRISGGYDAGVLDIDAAEWEGNALQVTMAGKLDVDDMAVDGRATLRSRQGRPVRIGAHPIEADRLTVQATITKTLLAPDLALKVEVGRVAVPDGIFTGLTGKGTFRSSRRVAGQMTAGEFAASGRVAGVDIATGPGVRKVIGRPVDWKAGGNIDFERAALTVRSLSLANALASLAGSGSFSYAAGTGAATLEMRIAELRPVGAAFGQAISGKAEVTVKGRIAEFGETLDARISGRLSGLEPQQPMVKKLVAGDVRLDGAFSFKPDALVLRDLSAKSAAASVRWDGLIPLDGAPLKAKFRAEISEGVSLVPAQTAKIRCRCVATGEITGKLDDPDLVGDLVAKTISVRQFNLDEIATHFDLRRLASAPMGPVKIDAKSRHGPLTLRADMQLDETVLRLTAMRFAAAGTTVDGAIALPVSESSMTGDLRFKIATLQPWLELSGMAGGGSGIGRLILAAEGRRQRADLNLELSDARIETGAAETAIRAKRLSLKAASSDVFAAGGITAELEVTEATAGEASFKRVMVSMTGSASRAEIGIKAAGQWIDPIAVEASLVLAAKGGGYDIAMNTLTGRALDREFTIARPFRVRWNDGGVSVDGVALALGEANATASIKLTGDTFNGTVMLARWPLAVTDRFWPLGLAGTLNSTLSLTGTRSRPVGTITADISDFRLSSDPKENAVRVAVKGDWRGGRVVLKASARNPNVPPASAEANLPLRLAADRWAIVLPQKEPLSARANWKGDTATIWKFLPFAWHQFSGPGRVEATVSGTYARPKVEGQIAVRNGVYESLQLGTVLKPVNLTVEFDGSKARLANFSAGDGNSGTMNATGSVTLDPALRYPFEFDLTLASFHVARRDDFDASASGKITAKGVLDAAKIVGRLNTETVELRVLNQLPPEVVDLAVVEEGSRAASADRKRQTPEPRFDPVLDIVVDMPGRVFVRGRGIDSEWKGRLALAGTLEDPRVSGKIDVVRGQMSVIGKVFRVKTGTVVLPESSNAEPEILLIATHEGKRLTAEALAAGPVTRPKITLSSTPDLPQDEIVSQILFSKSASKLSGIEAAQLAVALAQLSGAGGGGGGVLEFARKTLGVDVLRIETSNTAKGDEPSVGAGKYLTEGVYLGVKQGATPESGSVGVEVEVTPNITVESEMRRSGVSDVGVKFKLDY